MDEVVWQPIETAPEGVPVKTVLCDEHGPRNFAVLVRKGRLWFFPDMSMYVYYTPTGWLADSAEVGTK